MLNVKLDKDKDGQERVLVTCDHQRSRPVGIDEQACKTYRKGTKAYLCGKRLRNKKPKENLEQGCPGGYMACLWCRDVVARFLEASQDARAVRKEWL